jgi:hypothetical protein
MERRVFRRWSVALGIGAIWLLPTAFLAIFALDATVPGTQRVVYGVLAGAFGLLALRTARVAVVTDARGVTVRNALWTTRLPWSEVARFEQGRWRGWGSFPCGVVRRTDGRQVTAFALNPPMELSSGLDRRTPDLLAQLNAELDHARSGEGGQPSAGSSSFSILRLG